MKLKNLFLACLSLLTFYTCETIPEGTKVTSISSISFNPTLINLKVGEVKTASIDVAPNTLNFNISDISITYSVPNIVSLTINKYKEGVFTFTIQGINEGSTNLTLSLNNSDKKASAVVKVTANVIPLNSINLSKKTLTLNTNDTHLLTTNVSPKNATDTSVTWTTTNSDLATVSNTGRIIALKAGTVKITATSNSDNTISEVCTVTINEPVKSIEATPTSFFVKIGTKATLTAQAKPTTATNPALTFRVENTELATIVVSGNVATITPLKEGLTNIIITSISNSNVTLKVQLSIVFEDITSLNIVEESKTLDIDESYTLNTEILPEDASDTTLTWLSEKPEIVKVLNGVITGVKSGTSKIYAVSNADNTFKDSITVNVRGIILNKYTLKLDKNMRETLTAQIFPTGFNTNTISWSSSKSNIASVNASTGEVTGVAIGETDIIATLQNTVTTKPAFTAICKVSVSIFLKTLTLTTTRYALNKNAKVTLVPVFSPSEATDKTLKYTSSDINVASVNDNGEITAISIGEANIKAVSNFDTTLKATAKVFVKGIILNTYALDLKFGNIDAITAKLYPSDFQNSTLNWVSSSPDVVSVDNSGNIQAKKEGTATITVTSAADNTITASCVVKVAPSPYGITISHTNLVLNKRDTMTITAEIIRSSITNKNIVWTSDNKNVASINANGLITTHIAGSANIIATSVEDNTIKDTCKVSVDGINLDVKTLSIPKGKTGKFTPTVIISKSTDLSVTYTSSNAKATVDANGLITAKDTGIVNIIVTSVNNSKLKDTCVVTVQGLQFNVTSLEVKKGVSQTVTVTAYPTTLNGGITWSSENGNFATVSNGTINGIGYGVTNIVATYTANLNIVEKLKVTTVGIELDQTTLSIPKGKTAILKHTGLTAKTNQSVKYTSSDPTIASVDNNGLVTAIAQGEVTITVTFVSDLALTATCTVKVQGLQFRVSSSVVTSLEVKKSVLQTVTVTAYPSTLTGGITLSSENVNFATVNNGIINGVNYGVTNIVATYTSIPDIVEKLKVSIVGIELDNHTLSIPKGRTANLKQTGLTVKSTDQSVQFTSSDVTKATVSNTGLVTALSTGEVFIKVAFVNDATLKDSCKVTVQGMNLNVKTLNILKLATSQITATVYPTSLNGAITWSSSAPGIASVSSTGLVTGVSSGTATITATLNSNSAITENLVVTVADKVVESISLDITNLKIYVDESKTLTATILPTDALDKSITWQTSNANIATVINGVVTGKSTGTATITAVTVNSSIKASCTVKVEMGILSFKFEASKNPGMIKDLVLTKYGVAGFGGDFIYIGKNNLIPTFTSSTNAGGSIKVNSIEQTSGTSEVDFTSPVIYDIVNSNGVVLNSFRVSLNFINDTMEIDNNGVLMCRIADRYTNVQTAILADSMNGKKVLAIGATAFGTSTNAYLINLKSLKLPNSLLEIKDTAFAKCFGLEIELNLPPNLTTIGNAAFRQVSNFYGSLTIPNSVTSIGEFAFFNCYFDGTLILSNKLTILKQLTFKYCGFKGELVIPESITTIESEAFANVPFTKVKIKQALSTSGNIAADAFKSGVTIETY